MCRFPAKEFFVSNLLLITDVARLRKIFGRLTEDKNIRLRIVSNLEKGAEEIAIEKPDVVFVQTHLSGLSADILLMHLKKQLGRKRVRFVLLASPGQTSAAILKPFQGWLDSSAEDGLLFSQLQHLLVTFLVKPMKVNVPASPEPATADVFKPQPISSAEASAILEQPAGDEELPLQQANNPPQIQIASPPTPEPSLEEQGITYAPRQRLSVYSEFTSSFDNAVSSIPEPETLEQASPAPSHGWDAESGDTVESKPNRSKRGAFLLWLLPVVLAVVLITYLQQPGPATGPGQTPPPAAVKPGAQAPASANATAPGSAKPVSPQVTVQDQDRMSDSAVLSAIAESRASKGAAGPSSGARLTTLPDFIPRNGLDKQFSAANPGWERYRGQATEFKVLRESQAIKAIQIIDRGGQGVPESFMKGVLGEVTKNPVLAIDSTEKKEGYEIRRGRIAGNIKVVYYRDANGGKLRAFVLVWQ